MRKKILYCFFAVLAYNSSFGQEESFEKGAKGLRNFSGNYFRSDPFSRSFSGFLKHLINDPDIYDKNIKKKTDTIFLSFFRCLQKL